MSDTLEPEERLQGLEGPHFLRCRSAAEMFHMTSINNPTVMSATSTANWSPEIEVTWMRRRHWGNGSCEGFELQKLGTWMEDQAQGVVDAPCCYHCGFCAVCLPFPLMIELQESGTIKHYRNIYSFPFNFILLVSEFWK